jgi:hypothetical protein
MIQRKTKIYVFKVASGLSMNVYIYSQPVESIKTILHRWINEDLRTLSQGRDDNKIWGERSENALCAGLEEKNLNNEETQKFNYRRWKLPVVTCNIDKTCVWTMILRLQSEC